MGRGRPGGGRRWGAALLAGIAAVSLALVSGSTEDPPWAEQALQWVAARTLAAHRSVAELVQFESPDTVHLLCCNQRGPLSGRESGRRLPDDDLAYTADDGRGCPGGVAVQLQIEHGKVVAERRYHDVAAMRRCVGAAHLPDGWWTHAATPPPLQDEVTGSVTVAGRSVEVHNGTAAAEQLVQWAMARFPAAGLAAPRVSFVAFREEAHQEQCSGGAWGMAVQPGDSARVSLCLAVEDTPTPFERTVILHELAHAWMWQELDDAVQPAFVARMTLPGWDGAAIPWEKRGIEQAADVIAWGLTDDTLAGEEIARRSCPELVRAYRLLTQHDPQRPPCRVVTPLG